MFGANVFRASVQTGVSPITVGGFTMVSGQIITFVVAIGLAVLLPLFMHRTYLGRALRAVAQHRYAALLMGVHVKHVRSEEGRVGKECCSQCRSRWSRDH